MWLSLGDDAVSVGCEAVLLFGDGFDCSAVGDVGLTQGGVAR
jgi:hypothetical protein